MNIIKTLFLFGLIPFFTSTTFSQTNPLNGAWKFQAQESKKPVKKVRFTTYAPESLIIVIDQNEATINEIFTEIVQTRTIKTEVTKNESSANFQVSANLKNKKLKVETVANDGKQLIEIYEISGNRLKVSLFVFDAEGQKLFVQHRVYKRSFSEDFSSDNSEN